MYDRFNIRIVFSDVGNEFLFPADVRAAGNQYHHVFTKTAGTYQQMPHTAFLCPFIINGNAVLIYQRPDGSDDPDDPFVADHAFIDRYQIVTVLCIVTDDDLAFFISAEAHLDLIAVIKRIFSFDDRLNFYEILKQFFDPFLFDAALSGI